MQKSKGYPPGTPTRDTQILGGDVTSRNQNRFTNDKGRQRRDSLGTSLVGGLLLLMKCLSITPRKGPVVHDYERGKSSLFLPIAYFSDDGYCYQ